MGDTSSTAIQLLLDRSGSMNEIRGDAEGGIRAFIEDQRGVPGECTLRVSQFDDTYELVRPSTPITDVVPPKIIPRGRTALLDAWGQAMTEFLTELGELPALPDHVIFVVVTDGYENSSREWTRAQIFARVTELRARGWEFLFLAAGQDAVHEGVRYGVPAGHTMTFDATAKGVGGTYSAVSDSVTRTRGGGSGAFTAAERATARPDS